MRVAASDERGLAAPLVVTLTGLLLVLTLVAGGLGRLLVDHRRVATAADLAALAGAGAVQVGGDPCVAARAIAARNAAALVSCQVSGEQVTVRTQLSSTGFGRLLGQVGGPFAVEAEAHAGPVG